MSPSKEYSGVNFELAIGEIYGLRMWRMDEFGRLRARNTGSAKPWKPGINEAECLSSNNWQFANPKIKVENIIDPSGEGRKAVSCSVDHLNSINFATGGITTAPAFYVTWDDGATEQYAHLKFNDETPEVEKPLKHEVPVESCTCGFYAYSDPQHEETASYDGAHTILGIIKGTGRTLIGTKGFRCQKAEIIALRDPTRGGERKAIWRVSQLRKLEKVYPDVPILSSRKALLDFAPIEQNLPEPGTEDFWNL